jgi:nucleotide-binding universal stress UspA family protein
MGTFTTILCPTDFSAPSQEAFRIACSLARDYGAKLILLHVKSREPNPSGVMTMPPEPPDVYEERQRQLNAIQAAVPGIQLERQLVIGNEVEDILRTAADKKCDLIVMGTHGRTGLRRLLMGSVAEKVLREAPCAVLTVRTAEQPK